MYAADLTQYISQGSSEVTRIGDTISDVFARISATWSWVGLQGGTTRIWQGGSVRLMLVRTTTPVTGVTQNVLTDVTGQVNNIFLNSFQSVNSFVNDTTQYKVLAQKWIHSHQTTDVSGNYGPTQIGFMSKLLTPKHHYIDGAGNQLGKNYQYYIFVTSSAPNGGSSDVMGTLQMSALVSYKDA